MVSKPNTIPSLGKAQAVILLRWVLIIATSYLVLFSRPMKDTPPHVAAFVAIYLSSNILLTGLLPHIKSQRTFDIGVVLFDTLAVSLGMALTDNASSDFFLLYFVVMFLGALTERLGIVVGAAVLISAVHLYTVQRFVGIEHLIVDGYILRIPFLFVVALFFGHLVENTRSAERNAEEARERERLRSDFISAVTHDLKNPLGLVQNMSALLLDGEAGSLNDQQTNLVRRIHANVRQVISLSLNLLDASRIEAGRLTVVKRPARLPDLVDDGVSLARSAADIKGVKLRVATEPDLPGVEIDFMQMGRVLANLLDNAIKYTPSGTTVTVSMRSEGDAVLLSVADNGPGIPEDDLARIFEKYQRQLESSRVQGSGLGLFIVKAIVEAHGGSVAVDSRVADGTTFTIRLPAGQAASAGADRAAPGPSAGKSRRWVPAPSPLRAAARLALAGVARGSTRS